MRREGMAINESMMQLIWVLVGGYIIRAVSKKQTVQVLGEPQKRWSKSSALLLMIPLILWATYRSLYIGDTGTYVNAFNRMPDTLA